MWRCVGLGLLALTLFGCGDYAKFIKGLNDREVNSCVEGQINVGFPVTTGMAHIYTGTGGAKVSDCIVYLRGGTPAGEVK